ncbi:tetratricopeptide repeat protein [Selenomonas sp. AB3002]|uniref:tetratricopeptide repeat protein n=1 Tax=Selenomonas sp. AB3002 TaxID=1392502 RepID=UPI00163B5F63
MNNDIPQHIPQLAYFLAEKFHDKNAIRIYSRISEIGRAYIPSYDYMGDMRLVHAELVHVQRKNKDLIEAILLDQNESLYKKAREFLSILNYDDIKNLGYDELDLFYNERRMGMWNGQTCIDFEAAFMNSISLYNNRKVMDILQSRPFVERVQSCIYNMVLDSDSVIGADKRERLLKRIKLLIDRRFLDDAIMLLNSKTMMQEKPFMAYRELARCYYWKKDFEKAVQFMDAAIKLNPVYNHNPWFVREKCCYLYMGGEYEKCIEYIFSVKRGAEMDYVMLAKSYARLNDEKAYTYAKKCFEINTDKLLLIHGYPEQAEIWKDLFAIVSAKENDVMFYRKKYEIYVKSRGIKMYPSWYGEMFELNKKEMFIK